MIYVIQEHKARHLHWDLRLESEGKLLSWVLRKNPPQTTGIKRLAIPVADHPLEWASFEGTIAQGYGKGTVKIWDEGCVEWITRTNHRYFFLQGKKLRGCYTLAPFHDNFLFYKVCEEQIKYYTFKEGYSIC